MDDLISRSAVLDELNKYKDKWHEVDDETFGEGTGLRIAIDVVETTPTVDRWIPCSEGMPNAEDYRKCNGQFIVSDGERTYATYFDIYETLRFGEPTLNTFRIDRRVIAWKMLPEPYKGR